MESNLTLNSSENIKLPFFDAPPNNDLKNVVYSLRYNNLDIENLDDDSTVI